VTNFDQPRSPTTARAQPRPTASSIARIIALLDASAEREGFRSAVRRVENPW
jgi:hypothetical protein